MVDINSIIKLINTNNDSIIQKNELESFVKSQNSQSAFTGYFSTISKDISIDNFYAGLVNFSQHPEHQSTPQEINYFEYKNYECFITVALCIEDIPKGSHNTIRDARRYDISKLNLTKDELLNLCIDKTTILSDKQRAIIDEYTEKMKDPGLGIRALHEQGFTGKGVKMAIIDQPLGEHQEYSSNIAEHYDINATEIGWTKASMHGAAVTSIAVGETTGVAPGASVNYYSAINLSTDPEDIEFYRANLLREIENNKEYPDYVKDLQKQLNNIDPEFGVSSNQPYVDAINQILDKNEKLPENERVSVVSISWAFDSLAPGYEELQQALSRAKEQGVFIVSGDLEGHYGFNTCGANRNPQADPNDPKSYEAGAFWKDYAKSNPKSKEYNDNHLLVPMDHRTVADFTDGNSFRYEGNDGGMSWATPWLAGMYTLAKQANPDITPEEFWHIALETSDKCQNNDDNSYVGRIINPQKLITKIK